MEIRVGKKIKKCLEKGHGDIIYQMVMCIHSDFCSDFVISCCLH